MKLKNILSLFDGISCGQLALNRAGIEYENYYASEIEANAIKITQANYPKTVQLGDVRFLDFTKFENVDLLIGGSPCQDLSIAKENRKGLSGERSGLFFRFVDALRQCKPKYFLLENVASMKKENKDIITQILGVEPVLINSDLVSAQSRKRLYWTNIGQIGQPENLNIFLKDIVESGETYDSKSYPITANYAKKTFNSDFPKSRASFIGEPILYQRPRGKNNGNIHLEKSTTLTANSWEHNNVVLEPVPCASRTWPRKKDGRPRVKRVEIKTDGKANSLTLRDTDSMVLERVLRVEIRSDGKANALGQNVQQSQVLEPATTEKKGTIITVKNKTVTTKNGVVYPIDLPDGDYIVRKLTPIECERLQTLPDNYTAHVSNTQRYKAIGNGWTVDVIAHIFRHLTEETQPCQIK
jgi:DNA (cytosine-5)-methyltransferase 3A